MAAKTRYTCPNCGSTLYTGWAEGDILVCRDNEDPANGCLAAWDPADLDVGAVVLDGSPATVEGAPQLGPPNEADIHANPPAGVPDPDPSGLPYEGPAPISSATTPEDTEHLTEPVPPTADSTVEAPPAP